MAPEAFQIGSPDIWELRGAAGLSIRLIASWLEWQPSTISRELRKMGDP
ncbi:helix-turn-helix domain-containing protein [Ralstonia pseudosolanacearum]